jgi:DNA polymerase III epsilon subunit-like protein
MRVREAELTVLDFETTGSVEGYPTEAWQLGMIRIRKGAIDPTARFNRLLQVGDRPFNPYAPGRHHQVRDALRQAPELRSLWAELKDWWLNRPMVAHNVGTEQKFVRQTAPMHAIGPWIDTLKLARYAYPDFPSHSLEDLVSQLELGPEIEAVCPGLEAHDAYYDAVACAALLLHFMHLPGWESVTVESLSQAHPEQFYTRAQGRK